MSEHHSAYYCLYGKTVISKNFVIQEVVIKASNQTFCYEETFLSEDYWLKKHFFPTDFKENMMVSLDEK